MIKADLVKTLLDIDEEVSLSTEPGARRPSVVLVGGAAFMLRDLTSRSVTHDIDVLMADETVRVVMRGYPNVNGAVASFADQIPYNFEDRLLRLEIGSKAVDFLVPSDEDLVVMKLYAARPNDMQDIECAARSGKLDWSLLEHLVYGPGEADASILSQRRYREMVDAYEEFKGRFAP